MLLLKTTLYIMLQLDKMLTTVLFFKNKANLSAINEVDILYLQIILTLDTFMKHYTINI